MIGIAGIGKSRLAWEFEKYIDGLIEDVWWHRGRCLAYGEGVAYWALAEMVRWRSGIVEDEESASARSKLRETVERFVPEAEEREWIEPRLRHLLGLTERTAADQEDLFSAWRRFFELMAPTGPLVLLFEDLHWADAGLLDFVEYLLEWSRSHPIFVLTLARPELLERRPSWGARRRSFNSLFLEPLEEEAREELLHGLVPGLPDDLRSRIGERAEGVPLYAVETVRMLLDRGLVTRDGDGYHVTGSVDALEVPETLHALIAARLDGLEPVERRLLDDASVLGKTFTLRGLAHVSGEGAEALEPILASLIRKEILALQADPFSPERGQYEFLHALVQRVAYDTLSRRERKVRHLAVAAYLEANSGPMTPRSSRSSPPTTWRHTASHRTRGTPPTSRRWRETDSRSPPSVPRRWRRTRRPSGTSRMQPGWPTILSAGRPPRARGGVGPRGCPPRACRGVVRAVDRAPRVPGSAPSGRKGIRPPR